MNLKEQVEALRSVPAHQLIDVKNIHETISAFLEGLNNGTIRAAERQDDGTWTVNTWVKEGILLLFRKGRLVDMSEGENFSFFDKDTIPTKTLTVEDNVRIVPGGSTIRTGAYLAHGVICMPPMYVNIGAYVDEGTMIDSHALVGTCAQIGMRVHISAAAQIGGVLEPAGARPVVIENDVLIGGNCGVYEGVMIRERAVLGSGVIVNASTPVYDLVHGTILRSTAESPLEIPAGAVVVAGARAITSDFGRQHGLSVSTPLIVKYRDEKTDARTALEDALR
ncbi:MAG TPA: 2,3,4,5-tetrahydropyridine-2,6-dicarboxylate N-succinyltransferase [Bacteroidetes bacterium]|nr:2,3,4,5-tetrahydropyridine-2,6-dicarboxylate N-succinyltransferase [Bacteroidota bacterium]HRK03777.1 2,3,4,5-tetrahydropyridine-2,6-dicarboxylate N-succinyltransferase [Chlorobiota bacterium]